MKYVFTLAMVAALLFDLGQWQDAHAKTTLIMDGKVVSGGKGAGAAMGEEQKLMFEASNKFVAMDYRGAEELYSRIIAMNSGSANAWLQRGVVRRELGDRQGMESDAKRALLLIDNDLAQNANDAVSYQRRSMALRLLRRFDEAEQDVQRAMRMGAGKKLENDLKAIALERKMAQ